MQIDNQITFLPTKNLQSTSQFYTEKLELKIFLDQGDCIIFNTCPNAFLGFCEKPVNIVEGKIIITFIVSNVDEIYSQLITKQIKEISEPTVNEKYRIYHFFVVDPNGYLIEYQKFLDQVL